MSNKNFYVCFILLILFAQSLFANEPKFVLELNPRDGGISFYFKNNTDKKIILPDNLRGGDGISILIYEDGELIPNPRWMFKEIINPAFGGGSVFVIEPNEEIKDLCPILEHFISKNGAYYYWYVIRDVPDNPKGIKVSNPIYFLGKENWLYNSRRVTKDEIPKKVYDRFMEEINKIKHEPPISRP